MKIVKYPKQQQWPLLMQRPSVKQEELFTLVNEVFASIKKTGDKAVKRYSRVFDKSNRNELQLSEETIRHSAEKISPNLQRAIRLAKRNIEKFHAAQREKKQVIETTKGVRCWRETRAIEHIGIYIPGGTAPLFSTVLMLGIPAKLAGCKEIVLCTPPGKNGEIYPAILFSAMLVGITKIFAVGGIQAIGAMVFGTQSIPKVDKLFGPGNQYVTAAKLAAQNLGVAIDLPAGPSELLVIADSFCDPQFVAADLLSQAEHGADSQVMLLSDNEAIVQQVLKEIKQQLKVLPRKEMAAQALRNSRAIVLNSIDDCIAFSNQYAPEHLIMAIKNYKRYIANVINAGSVFLGPYSCESAGDYASGTNHTLPTNGYARNYSGVSLDSFTRKVTFQELDRKGIVNIGPAIEAMAEAEQLWAHRNAVTVRLEKLNTSKRKRK